MLEIMRSKGMRAGEIAETMGVSRSSVYNYLKMYKEESKK